MQNRFFAVTAKCGHVGRNHYYEGTFYIRALTGSEAAVITRNKPRVKHDHKDAILWVEEVTPEVYASGRVAVQTEAYFYCKNKQEQNNAWDKISSKLHQETELTHEYRQKKHKERRTPETKIKKPYKRESLYFVKIATALL